MSQSHEIGDIAGELSPPLRLAVAYAPASARPGWTALLALDQRLARAVAGASEPLIGQLKLAWWRDRTREPASAWPRGEPLLAALAPFDGERAALEALVDAWEAQIDADGDPARLAQLAQARGLAVAALARMLGCADDPDTIAGHARRWTDRGAWPVAPRLSRAMRPLAILANLPAPDEFGPLALLRIVRLGMLGR